MVGLVGFHDSSPEVVGKEVPVGFIQFWRGDGIGRGMRLLVETS